jgi:Zn-dependent peptidase ImmA (M78 family)
MLGDRLKLARKKSGYSMDALVAELEGEVTKQSLSKYERNQMMPGSRVLSRLSKALDVSLEFLMSAEVVALEGVDFRSKSNTTAKERAQVEATVIEHAERYLAIEEILGEEAGAWVDPEKTVIRTEADAEELAARYRKDWRLGLDPIPNLTALLEDLGIKVLMLDLPEKVSGLTCFVKRQEGADVPVIVVNANLEVMNVERRRMTLAHELFHRLAEVPNDAEIKEERLINRCAGAFLMPSRNVVIELGAERAKISYQELCSIKHRYGVSITALIVRLGQIGVLSEGAVGMIFRGPAREWRRSEPDPIQEPADAPLEQPERFERLCFHAFSEQYISRAKIMELLQLPYEQVEVAMSGPSPHANHC